MIDTMVCLVLTVGKIGCCKTILSFETTDTNIKNIKVVYFYTHIHKIMTERLFSVSVICSLLKQLELIIG